MIDNVATLRDYYKEEIKQTMMWVPLLLGILSLLGANIPVEVPQQIQMNMNGILSQMSLP
jgi:hypothetical protein